MTSQIKQLALPSSTQESNDLIPIFIAKSKQLISTIPNIINTRKVQPNPTLSQDNQILISNTSGYQIDKNSFIPSICYWKKLTELIAFTISTNNSSSIECSINIDPSLIKNSNFIVIDSNKNILDSKKIIEYNKDDSGNIILLKLQNNLSLNTGSYNFCIISLVNEILPYSFNQSSSILTVNFTNLFQAVGFEPVIASRSTVSYQVFNQNLTYTYISEITSDIIDSEQNLSLKIGLEKSNKAVIINYPGDDCFDQLYELIKSISVGYYVVPIDVSENLIIKLTQLLESVEDNRHLTLMFSISDNVFNKTLIKSNSYVMPTMG